MDISVLTRSTVAAVVLTTALAGCMAEVDAPDRAPGPVASSAPASPEATLSPSATPQATASASVAAFDVSRPDPVVAAREVGLDPTGAVAALAWRDSAGSNTLVLRELQPQVRGDKQLLADHIAVSTAGTRTVLREVRDGERDCEFDLTAEFVREALQVRDDDADGFGEVLFAYRLACRSDPSPSDLKLLSLEHGDKYILRGTSTNQVVPDPSEPEAEPAAESWPSGTYSAASALFNSVQKEF